MTKQPKPDKSARPRTARRKPKKPPSRGPVRVRGPDAQNQILPRAAVIPPPTVREPAAEPIGLVCSRCGCRHFFVLYTRPARGDRIRRRKECRHCGRQITTFEKPLSGD